MKKQNRNTSPYQAGGVGVQQYQSQMTHPQTQVTNQHIAMTPHPQQNRQKGNMMGVGIIKNTTPSSLPNNQMMPPSTTYPAATHSGIHQISGANQTHSAQPTVPIANQNGSVSVSVGGAKQQALSPSGEPVKQENQQTTSQNSVQQNSTPDQSQSTATATNSDAASCEQTLETGAVANPQSLANTKEKTPMCLINELARYNKIMHQYTLVDEQGPAHKKIFYVQLKLGDGEEYSASGPSIKKAQHAAAAQALQKTAFNAPPPKPAKTPETETIEEGQPVTPTVKLNALAMKRGEQTFYKPIETRTQSQYYQPQNYNYRGMYNQRYHYPRMPRVFYVSLKVGAREFVGEGHTRQDARHDAAKKALNILEKLPTPTEDEQQHKVVECPFDLPTDAEKDNMKSEISLVHEIALKRNLSVGFEVTRESGPPHMKTFVTCCRVGDYITESEGNSKKVSKKKAAELMLEKLKELPPLPPSTSTRLRNKPLVKKKNKNLIKQQQVQKADPNYGVGINPISRLIQIQQAQQKKEPVYTLVTERGLPRRREFVIQVQVDERTCTGVGPNKKLAKRHAAEAMLTLMGFNKPSPQPSKPAIKTASTPEGSGEKKVTFQETTDETGDGVGDSKAGRQLMPGLLLLPDSKYNGGPIYGQGQSHQGMGDYTSFASVSKRPEVTLRELATANGLEVKFDEFQSGQSNSKQSEYLSRVTLLFTPPRVFHGSGGNSEAARDLAALEALKFLQQMGKDRNNMAAAGDGPHVQ